jgi:hypothetical protein
MSSNTRPRIALHTGVPEGEASMPTCGVCRRQIGRGTTYASVASSPGLRETRHNTEACLRWQIGTGADLAVGSVVTTHRYMVCEWGGLIDGRITERTEEFNSIGWRRYMIEPVDPADTTPIERFRNHPEPFFRNMAESLVIDPAPREVFISDTEFMHYLPPAPAAT